MNEIILKSLSAAEINTLQNPNQEQVKQALPLILKEMALHGWITVRKIVPQLSDNWFSVIFLGLFTALLFMILPAMAMIFALVAFAVLVHIFSKKIELQITRKGHEALRKQSQPALLITLLREIQSATDQKQRCTMPELKKHLRKKYQDNNGFHQNLLLHSLLSQSLIGKQADGSLAPTALGEKVLTQVAVKMEEALRLPALIRSRSPQALALAAALGGIVLLIPDMEGYFAPLHELQWNEMNLDEERDQQAYASDGGTTYIDSNDQEKHHDPDWGDNSDFLDGQFDSSDGGLSAQSTGGCGNGCGIDSSGCGSSGCGSGCGGGGCGGGCGS